MRRLLLHISVGLILAGCGSDHDAADNKESEELITGQVETQESGNAPTSATKSKLQHAVPAAESNTEMNEEQPELKTQVTAAPEHLSPEQNEVDSIKAAKLKLKKR